jgi:hypothetical protein
MAKAICRSSPLLVQITGDFQATDPRGKIYGPLGLCPITDTMMFTYSWITLNRLRNCILRLQDISSRDGCVFSHYNTVMILRSRNMDFRLGSLIIRIPNLFSIAGSQKTRRDQDTKLVEETVW